MYYFMYLNFLLLFYFWLCWVFVATWVLPLVVVGKGCSSLRHTGFSLRWLLIAEHLSSNGQASAVGHMGLLVPQHVKSSETRAQTRALCIGR